jgi:small ligand-binding sensory domain FIST
MTPFFQVQAVGDAWRAQCEQALTERRLPLTGEGLGFVYLTDALAAQAGEILAYLQENTGVRHWVGSIASGVISSTAETYDGPALSLLITDLRDNQFRLLPTVSDNSGVSLAPHRPWIDASGCAVAVVHGDPRQPRIGQLIGQLSQGLNGGFLVGGLSSGDQADPLQIADGPTDGGISGVMLSGDVPIATGVTQGCSLFGNRHEITRSEGSVIMQLDERPALDVFFEELGPGLANELNRVAGRIFAALPVPGSDTGDYLVRNLIGFDPERRLLAVGDNLRQGMHLQFARRDQETAREDLVLTARRVRGRIRGTPRGALYFSCLGRGRNLFGENSAELRLLQRELGSVPLAGFYANGEISHNRLYGYTGVIAVFGDPAA